MLFPTESTATPIPYAASFADDGVICWLHRNAPVLVPPPSPSVVDVVVLVDVLVVLEMLQEPVDAPFHGFKPDRPPCVSTASTE
jgi:hypothetical protein